jgi:hypothetical protein
MRDRALPFAAAYAEIVIVPVAQREASQADTNRPAAPRIRLPGVSAEPATVRATGQRHRVPYPNVGVRALVQGAPNT